jgi:TetR/AcrR family transcriptional repressor of nem operon
MSDDMKTRLLDAAQHLVQTRGHNGYSYRDLAEQVGIRTASIHYHFPTKTDLAVAVVRRYRQAVVDAMANIAVQKTLLADRLNALCGLFAETLKCESRVCISCALAGEYLSLPPEVQVELKQLIQESEQWIARFLTEGHSRGEVAAELDPVTLAQLWYAALQGGLVMARANRAETLTDITNLLKQMTLKKVAT